MAETSWTSVLLFFIIGGVIGLIVGLSLTNNIIANIQKLVKPSISAGADPRTWTIKAEAFSNNEPLLFNNPKYARGPMPDGINKIFANPAYGTASDLIYGEIPTPTDLIEWRIPFQDNKRKDEMVNSFGPQDEKSVMNVNGEIGIKNWIDDTHYKNQWGDTICDSCQGGSKSRHKKKDLNLKENMLNPGVYDQCNGCSRELPIMPTHVIPSYYYKDEWKSRFRRNIWNKIWH